MARRVEKMARNHNRFFPPSPIVTEKRRCSSIIEKRRRTPTRAPAMNEAQRATSVRTEGVGNYDWEEYK